MPAVNVDAGDAAELAEFLRFLHDWLGAEHDHLDASLQRFVGNPAYDIGQRFRWGAFVVDVVVRNEGVALVRRVNILPLAGG